MKTISLEINGILFDNLDVAECIEDKQTGQMFKKEIDEKSGMVYVSSRDSNHFLFNDNPYCSFDVILVNSCGIIVGIATMEKANHAEVQKEQGSRPRYGSPQPCCYIFELKAGSAQRIGAKIGDKLDVDYSKLIPYRNSDKKRYVFQLKEVETEKDWINPLLKRLERIVNSQDALRDLNLHYVGTVFDIDKLPASGWAKLDGIDKDNSGNLWFQKNVVIRGQKMRIRLCTSIKGHYRHLYLVQFSEDGAFLKGVSEEAKEDVCNMLYRELEDKQLGLRPGTMEEERDIIIGDTSSSSIDDEWSEDYKKCYLWMRLLVHETKKSKYLGYRILNGMLRFEHFYEYDTILGITIAIAANLGYSWAMAKLVSQGLSANKDSQCDVFWDSVGCALDRLQEKEAAFFCFSKSWHLDPDPIAAENLWAMGIPLVKDALSNNKCEDVIAYASAMLSAIPDKATKKEQVNLMCALGLVHESRRNYQEAENIYKRAFVIYWGGKSKDFSRYEYPLLFQSLKRCNMEDQEKRMEYVSAQMKSYPVTPLEIGYGKRIPVEYEEGEVHGDHWETVVPELTAELISEMVEQGKCISKAIEIPEYEQGDGDFKNGMVFIHSREEDGKSPIGGCIILGCQKESEPYQLASGFPVFRKGKGASLVRKILRFDVWDNALEASADFYLRETENMLSFFLPDYCGEFLRVERDSAYRIEIGMFAYSVSLFEKKEIVIRKGVMLEEEKLRRKQEGEDDNIDSVSLQFDDNFCNFSRGFSGCQDDISITGPIVEIDSYSFFGQPCLTLWIQFDERGANIKLPVFLRSGILKDGFMPQVGDVVNCDGWLQGWINEPHELPDNSNHSHEQEDQGFDLSIVDQALVSIVSNKDADLSQKVCNALKQIAKAEDVMPCPDLLSGDAEYSCKINGKTVFVKAMTGYFDNEKDCQTEWQRFKAKTHTLPDTFPLYLVSIVGIKSGNEYHHIYYNGFSELNPDASTFWASLNLETGDKD